MATLILSVVVAGEMVKLLQNKSDFPRGVTSLTNIQRQFFDSFVGQTFQVFYVFLKTLNGNVNGGF